jgi:ectoine hydroxylase-related dioxygenase (phytanoyl-CoA dioxygenase family)
MNARDAADFIARPFAKEAVRLRRYDEAAKDPAAATPPLSYYLTMLARLDTEPAQNLHRDGFIVLPNYWSAQDQAFICATADRMGARAADILRSTQALGRSLADAARHGDDLIVVAEADDPLKVCRFEYLMGADAAFADFVRNRITPVVSEFGGEDYLPFKDKENEKHPGGGAFRPHQDFAAYQAFGPRFNLTAMLTIEPQTMANGCLAFATNLERVADTPGFVEARIERRTLLKFYDGGPQNGDVRDDIVAQLDWRHVETSPADLVIFDSFVPHKSAANGTSSPRRAMFLTHSRAREGDWYDRYYADKRANFDAPRFHVSTPTARE